jgi:uncharacterized membrane protein (DUF441 family)
MADTPLAETAEKKAEAKMTADVAVATEHDALHGVKTMVKSPAVVASTVAGAAIGAMAGGPPGALIGAGVGFLVEKHKIASGPVGRLMRFFKRG